VLTKFIPIGLIHIPNSLSSDAFLSRRHTTNKCWPTLLANKSLMCVQKVGQHFMLANNVCRLRTCLFFLLANKRQTVHCDWLAVANIMAAESMDVSCVDYTNYTSPFYLYIIHDCTHTDFGHLRFPLRANHCCSNVVVVCQVHHLHHILLSNKMLSCVTFVGRVSAA